MPAIYSAVKRFDPACGESWRKYVEWSGLSQLREIISLDLILRPSVIAIDDLTAEEWQHNVNENFKCIYSTILIICSAKWPDATR